MRLVARFTACMNLEHCVGGYDSLQCSVTPLFTRSQGNRTPLGWSEVPYPQYHCAVRAFLKNSLTLLSLGKKDPFETSLVPRGIHDSGCLVGTKGPRLVLLTQSYRNGYWVGTRHTQTHQTHILLFMDDLIFFFFVETHHRAHFSLTVPFFFCVCKKWIYCVSHIISLTKTSEKFFSKESN